MKLSITKNELPNLAQRLHKIEMNVESVGQQWAHEAVEYLALTYLEHLATQGRGGEPPPLSSATKYLYEQLGDPDGSGIRNHIQVIKGDRRKGKIVCTFGIPKGKPTVVAKVQDQGATIPVTPKMRGFLAAHGIYLKESTTHIHIPGRNSWTNSVAKSRVHAKQQLRQFWQKLKEV